MVATIAAGTSARYYLSLTSYYTGSGEPSGYWIKVGFAAGFAAGEVVKDADFEKLHAGLDEHGRPLLASSSVKALRVGGYDLSLSAPKTVSIRWATDEVLRGDIESAQAKAVEAAFALAEREAAFCRFGKGGKRREKTRLTAAAFLHGEARPAAHSDGAVFSDPDMHTHIVIMNIGPKHDAQSFDLSSNVQYGALDGKALFNWKMAIGACYHLTLATELQKLGLSIASVGKNGVFEIAGVDRQLIDYLSARRNSIKAELEKAGRESSEAPALAAEITRATRNAKRDHGEEGRFENWRKRIKALGFDPEMMRAC